MAVEVRLLAFEPSWPEGLRGGKLGTSASAVRVDEGRRGGRAGVVSSPFSEFVYVLPGRGGRGGSREWPFVLGVPLDLAGRTGKGGGGFRLPSANVLVAPLMVWL